MITKISHMTLYVRDPEKAYDEALLDADAMGSGVWECDNWSSMTEHTRG